jgi:sterol desaturase/sphingolipid hydroxylase (fatty acid hydroxylase superfamily)
MIDSVIAHESFVRIASFLGVLLVMAAWEVAVPRRRREIPRAIRWTNNLGIVLLDTLILRLTFPVLAVPLALTAEARGWGLLNVLEVRPWIAFVVSIVALDFVIYVQHVIFHSIPALWRLHRMHHADIEFDVSTGLRFHPIEIVLSMVLKLAAVLALGPPAVAVLAFEVLLNASSMFNHGNVRLPLGIDRALRWAVVTPDMHRVHHSVLPVETNSNFGFLLSWWDRALGTYRPQPRDGHEGMTIGLGQFRSRRDLRLDRMLWQPFRNPVGDVDHEGDARVTPRS